MKRGVKQTEKEKKKALKELVFLWSRQLSQLPYLESYFDESPRKHGEGLLRGEKDALKGSSYEVIKSFHNASGSSGSSSDSSETEKSSFVKQSIGIETVRIFVGLDEKQLATERCWAKKMPERALIVIEPRKSVLTQFFEKTEIAREVLLDKQVLIIAPENGLDLSRGSSSEQQYIAKFCIHSAFTLSVSPEIEKDPLWPSYRAKLLSHCGIFRSIKREALLSPDILDHILRNALPSLNNKDLHSIDFSDAPPIALCGAGPSLKKQIPILKKVQDRVLVIAAGSSVLALQKAGIRVDMVAGICAFPEHYQRWRQSKAFETPTWTCLRVHPGVLKLMQGPRVHLPGLSSSSTICFVERQMGYEGVGVDYGMSVTTATLKALEQTQAKQVFLFGVDLSYQDGLKYSEGIAHLTELKGGASVLDNAVEIEDGDGYRRRTLDLWLEERRWIEDFFRSSAMRGYRVEGAGLQINSVQHCSLEALPKKIERLASEGFDAHNFIWSKIAQCRDQSGKTEHLSQMLYAACDDLEDLSAYCEKQRQDMADNSEKICESLETLIEYENQFHKGLGDFWSYREFLFHVHWAVKAVQEKERFQLRKDLSLKEDRVCMGLFTLLAEQVVILRKRSQQVASALDLWIDRHLEGADHS